MSSDPDFCLVLLPLIDIRIRREEAIGIPEWEHDSLDRIDDLLFLEVHIAS